MSQSKSDNFQINAPKPIDNREGLGFVNGAWRPFSDIATAIASPKLAKSARYIGMEVKVYLNGVLTKYWFKEGIEDQNLVVQSLGASGSNFTYKSSAVYNSTQVMVPDYINSVIIPELIGADLGFFRAYRGTGTILAGSATAAANGKVQVDVLTGKVTYFDDFDPDVDEMLSFDYKTGGGTVTVNGYIASGYVKSGYTI